MNALLRRLRLDPYIVAIMAMVAVAAVMPARGAGKDVLDLVVHAAIALLFFIYGAKISPQAIWAGVTHWRLQGLVFATTFIVFPIIGFWVVTLAGGHLDSGLATGLMFVCLLPSTVRSSIAFTSIARGNVPAALCAASVSNLADRGSILLVVYSAFSAGVVAGIWSQVTPPMLALVLLLNMVILASVLIITTVAARVLGFSVADEIAIVFCGSKKSMASGLPMANILFPAATVGLIVLPLMLFHQMQLMACAALARRYSRRPEQTVPTVTVTA
ncbi:MULTISPECIES: bile acid:sodium symporter family protein [unclassified Brevundimonas]|uniref:bile acid:sodium symporter family protein n=1 Tax=unclassified Brevundimonas TaxID=2622653 RepID=UPI0025BB43C7|nr:MULTISPECIES: bile acid:sodium symporter family protein [unclassified Brevundimonas]